MKLSIKSFADIIKIGVIAVALGVGVGYVMAWNPAPGTAPNCPEENPACHTPINVSNELQVKEGALGVGSLSVSGESHFGSNISVWGNIRLNKQTAAGVPQGKLIINDGTAQPGYVLTSGDTSGTASWTAGGGVGGGITSTEIKESAFVKVSEGSQTTIEQCGTWGSTLHPCNYLSCANQSNSNQYPNGSCYYPRVWYYRAEARCDADEVATGGGFRNWMNGGYQFFSNPIMEGGKVVGWECVDYRGGRTEGRCYAVCVK